MLSILLWVVVNTIQGTWWPSAEHSITQKGGVAFLCCVGQHDVSAWFLRISVPHPSMWLPYVTLSGCAPTQWLILSPTFADVPRCGFHIFVSLAYCMWSFWWVFPLGNVRGCTFPADEPSDKHVYRIQMPLIGSQVLFLIIDDHNLMKPAYLGLISFQKTGWLFSCNVTNLTFNTLHKKGGGMFLELDQNVLFPSYLHMKTTCSFGRPPGRCFSGNGLTLTFGILHNRV